MLNRMETNSNDRRRRIDAQAALDGLRADRETLARWTRAAAWYYPALAIITAAIVAAPVLDGTTAAATVLIGACVALVLMERGLAKQSGLSANRPAGPRSLALLIAMGAVVLLSLLAVAMLVASDHRPWAAVPVGIAFLAMLLGGLRYDRVQARELRDAV